MTATGHAAVGIILAAKFQNPYIAIPLTLASHIVCDFVPHWDAGTHYFKKSRKRFLIEAAADVFISLALTYGVITALAPQVNLLYAYLIVFCAQWFDWVAIPLYVWFNKGIFKKITEFSEFTNITLDKPWGIITQIAFVAVLYLITRPF